MAALLASLVASGGLAAYRFGRGRKDAEPVVGSVVRGARLRALPGGWKVGASVGDVWSECPLVDLERGIDHPLPAARASDAPPPFSAKARSKVGVGEQAIDRGAERERISRRHEESCDLMLDELGEPANRARNDGPAVRHRFRTGEPETLSS